MTEISHARFVVVDNYLTTMPDHRYICVLVDYSFWHEHSQELKQWVQSTELDYVDQGMALMIPDDQALSLFLLRWA